jgi:hypothetical protein
MRRVISTGALLFHVLSKVDRVGYGLLAPRDLRRALRADPLMPKVKHGVPHKDCLP